MSFDLKALCSECRVTETIVFIEKCSELFTILKSAAEKTNLTRILDENDYLIKHVADSLMIGKFFPEIASEDFSIADIGCGAGFPSLILAIAYPRLKITALDSTGKKIAFVKQTAMELGLVNLEALQGRACELNRKKEWQERFDMITARAVGPAAEIYSDTSRMLKSHGRYILYKTPGQAEEEIHKAKSVSRGIIWRMTEEFSLPDEAGKRVFIYSEEGRA